MTRADRARPRARANSEFAQASQNIAKMMAGFWLDETGTGDDKQNLLSGDQTAIREVLVKYGVDIDALFAPVPVWVNVYEPTNSKVSSPDSILQITPESPGLMTIDICLAQKPDESQLGEIQAWLSQDPPATVYPPVRVCSS